MTIRHIRLIAPDFLLILASLNLPARIINILEHINHVFGPITAQSYQLCSTIASANVFRFFSLCSDELGWH